MRFLLLFGLAGSILILAFAATPQAADPLAPAAAPRGGGAQIPANGGRITLEVNKGTLVRLAGPAATVFVANPEIADVQVKSPTLVYISAKSPGETVIYAVDATDSVLLNAPILVQHDISRLRSSLQQLAPGERISANSVDNNLVLSGVVSDAGQADKVRALAASIAGEVKGSQVINRMTVATPNQVNLQVRIAEVNVTKLNEIGVNWPKIGSNLSFMTNNPVTIAGEATNTLIVGQGCSGAACHDQRPHAGGVHHGFGRAEPDGDVRSDRELPRRRRVSGADLGRLATHRRVPDDLGRIQELRCQPRLHPDGHRRAPSQPARPP